MSNSLLSLILTNFLASTTSARYVEMKSTLYLLFWLSIDSADLYLWLLFDTTIAEVFYGTNYWSPIITSKYSSEILSNHNKHLCFFSVFKTKWCNFLISAEEFVLITENFWRIFWRDHWWSIISTVENFRYCCIK